ncbi:transcription factor Spi-C [Pantherophis guttatus]|uniref:Transcription factor Spi-C n=1 Tax=Pantherophis guttatus TaxID=94885 RepID=A0ABM3ZR11_PANGU|nr:transcription factor Spi-C [Pantherophis guttatus]
MVALSSFAGQDLFGQALEDALEVLQQHSDGTNNYIPGDYKNYLTCHHNLFQTNTNNLPESFIGETTYNWNNTTNDIDLYSGASYCTLQTVPENEKMYATALQQKTNRGRKRLRLFEYILESLHNPDMANCIQWLDKANGVFQFISKNKEKLAEQWGERKGNRKVMTYQKMARALRNYGRTGEIIKIRRKLTYQFGAVVLRKLSLACFSGKDGNIDDQFVKAEQECLYAADWLTYQNCINQKGCDLQQDSSLTSSFYCEAY